MKRLRSYSRNLADYHLVMDLLPLLASLRFTDTLVTPLSHVQAAILLGMGLQGKSVERLEAELGLPASQILALYNKSMRKMIAALRSVQEEEAAAELPSETAASEATLRMTPLQEDLADELIEGAAKATQQMREAHMRKQQAWLADSADLQRYTIRGTDSEWEAMLDKKSSVPQTVSLKGEARSPIAKETKKEKKMLGAAKRKRGRSE
uniref:Possible tRNA binding domain-containing protein n=2 Tax=Haptolina ericina TaxID=156174 RepID=A0A7S3EV76_9EUKA|mmetsp:Transcript_27142/g.61339  ORF Transcript_27142/g.61339 Transcript_27142/m.61339 type:complete len:208 (+) Transcript_27142:105-728(+)